MKAIKYVLMTLLFFPISSWALFEARLSYTGLVSKDAVADVCTGVCTGTIPGMVPLYGLGADAIISLPLVPFGFGLRHEKLALSGSTSNMSAEANLTRTAVLMNYRLIDTIIHFGPIASYGLSHTGGMKISQNNSTLLDYSATSATTYSLGLELTVKPLIVIPIIVGAEAGYMGAKMNNVRDSVSGNSKDIDMSGTYMKVFLGLDI